MSENKNSVYGRVKDWIKTMPLGAKMNIHDLYKIFPDGSEASLSAALSSLKRDGILELLDTKIKSEWVVNGKHVKKTLNVYQLVKHKKADEQKNLPSAVADNIWNKNETNENVYFNVAFAAAPTKIGNPEDLYSIAKKFCYLSDIPLYDTVLGDEYVYRFGHLLAERLKDFNPEKDVLVFYGDNIIVGIAIFWLAQKHKHFKIARWSQKNLRYTVRQIDSAQFK